MIQIRSHYLSFTLRGVEDKVADQSKVPTAQMIRDAVAALQFLATHARIFGAPTP
jgi:hypothetical protein